MKVVFVIGRLAHNHPWRLIIWGVLRSLCIIVLIVNVWQSRFIRLCKFPLIFSHHEGLIIYDSFLLYSNIPLKDPSNVPDPYVKLYLLPGRSKETKRKTIIVKDSCNPVYDATFEYIISTAELNSTELEITVATQKGFLSGGSPIIGMVIFYKLLPLAKIWNDIINIIIQWNRRWKSVWTIQT